MNSVIIFNLILCLFVYSDDALDLPDYLPRKGKCSLETMNECLKNRIEFYRTYIGKGVPELDIDPIEPLRLNFASLSQGGGAVQVQSNFTDLIFRGMSGYSVKQVNIDGVTWKKLSFTIVVPDVRIECKYNMYGKVLLLPIQGKGTAHGRLKNLVGNCDLDIQLVQRDGHVYIKFINGTYNYDIGGLTLRFDNLFNGQRLLGETMNRFLNENWREIFLDVRKSFLGDIDYHFRTPLQKTFNKFYLAELFDVDEEEFIQMFKDYIVFE